MKSLVATWVYKQDVFVECPWNNLNFTKSVAMPPPSQLAVATSAVSRLVKEEASYHKELAHQQGRIKKLESELSTNEDENAEFELKQEVR